MKKVFIVGLSSFIGSTIARELKHRYLISGNYFHHPIRLQGVTAFPNIFSPEKKIEASLEGLGLNAIVYSAGVVDEQKIQKGDPEVLWGNFDLPLRLARFADDKGIPFIFFSSSKVFSGQEGDYSEEDAPHPQGNYGRLKLLVEGDLKRYQTSLVLRLGTAYGLGMPFQTSALVSRYLPLLREEKPFEVIVDEYRNFISGADIAKAIDVVLEKEDLGAGLYHLGNGQKDSYFSFAEALANVFGFEKQTIKAISGSQFRGDLANSGGARGTDLSLSGNQFAKYYRFKWPSLVENFYDIKARLKQGDW